MSELFPISQSGSIVNLSNNSLGELEAYLSALGTQFSLFDTPLHYNFKQAGDQGADYNLTQIFDNTIVQKRPIDSVCVSHPISAHSPHTHSNPTFSIIQHARR